MAERTSRTGHRTAELTRPLRVGAIAVIAAFAVVPFVAALSALAQGWQPTGDVAIIALRSLDVWEGDGPLVGQPTTAEEFTGRPSNHPGPIENGTIALATKVAGDRAGVVLGPALLNAIALGLAAWLGFRRGGPALLGLLAAALALLVWSLGAGSLFDPFNSELATYPMLLALLATWSLAVGDLRVAPALAFGATVAAQVHVAGAAFVAPLVIIGIVTVVLAAIRHPKAVARDRAYLFGALGVVAVLWLPVLANELGSGPSNVAALWTAATAPRPRIGLSWTLERVATSVAPIPVFMRRTSRFAFLDEVSAVQVYLPALAVAATASLAFVTKRRDPRNHPGRLSWVLLAATGVAVLSSAGQPPLSAFRADGTRWLWVVSLGVWVVLAWSGWNLLSAERRGRVATAIGIGGSALAVIVLVGALAVNDLGDQRDGKVMDVTDRTADALLAELDPGTYHVAFDGNAALVTVGPGVAYRLAADGSQVDVDDNSFTRGYGAAHTGDGPFDGRIRISSNTDAQPNEGEAVVTTQLVDPDDPEAGTITVFLAR